MEKVYVGLDMESSSFQQAALNHEGAKMNRSFPTSEANLREAFANLRGEIHMHLEAGELAPLLSSRMKSSQLSGQSACSQEESQINHTLSQETRHSPRTRLDILLRSNLHA